MISQLEKEYKHICAALSTGVATESEDGQPPRPTGRRACPTAAGGFTEEDIAALELATEDVFEGKAIPTTDKPRLVTRGPHPPQHVTPLPPSNRFTILDSLSFTAKEPYWVMQELLELTCPGLSWVKLKTGFNGYHSGYLGLKNKAEACKIFYGSKSNERQNEKCQVRIGGNGKCQNIDWLKFYHYAGLMEDPTITNIHVAYDVFDGSLTIEGIAQAHIDDKFKNPKSPKNPIIKPIGQIQPDGYNPGRSLYVGSMQSNKFIRFYEKAYEMFKGILTSEEVQFKEIRDFTASTIANGGKHSDPAYNKGEEFVLNQWVRAEIEFSKTNCDLPLDMLINHDDYFSQAYPFTKQLLEVADGKLVPRLKSNSDLDFLVRQKNMQKICGSFINDMEIMGYSNDEIVEALIIRGSASQKLIRSGVYSEG